MTIKKVRSIAIIGGGSAGYLTATYLANNLPKIKVTLVEPENTKPIGVGEATLASFFTFIEACGITDEQKWLDSVDGIVKNGILFKNWRPDTKDIWHPFFNVSINEYINIRSTTDYDYLLRNLPDYDRVVKNNIPSNNKGYHLNATKLIDSLKTRFLELNNTSIINDAIVKVNYLDNNIISLTGVNNTISADLFIDCTGFNGLSKLLPQVFKPNFMDCSQYLTCNAACAAPVSYEVSGMTPVHYTKATAVEQGWVWETSLKSRVGCGLVYNSACTTKEQAEKFMTDRYGKAILDKFNHIKFDPGYVNNPWRGNLVSVGLSNGFVEPLESSGIALFCDAAMLIFDTIKRGFFTEYNINQYNAIYTEKFEETIAFVSSHYNVKPFNSKFWDLANSKHTHKITEILLSKYNNDPLGIDYYTKVNSIFSPHSWLILFEGFNFEPIKFNIES